MILTIALVVLISVSLLLLMKAKSLRDRNQLERYTISPKELHDEMESGKVTRLYDVRQPLDLLAHLEMIPGSQRILPRNLVHSPELIPRDEDVVVYCTCLSDNTAQHVIRRALSMKYDRARLLRGGFEAWKGSGYATEPYTQSFSLV